jgi:hypothetical protein
MITIEFDAEIRDIDASREVILASLGDLGEHAEILIAPDLWHEAERLLKDGASYQEVHRTTGITRKALSKNFPGYGWTKQQGAEWREAKAEMDRATLTPSPQAQKRKTSPRLCGRGLHPMEGSNVYVSPNGTKVCKACRRKKDAAIRARKRAPKS